MDLLVDVSFFFKGLYSILSVDIYHSSHTNVLILTNMCAGNGKLGDKVFCRCCSESPHHQTIISNNLEEISDNDDEHNDEVIIYQLISLYY